MDIRWFVCLTHFPLTRIDTRFNDFSLSSNCASLRAIIVVVEGKSAWSWNINIGMSRQLILRNILYRQYCDREAILVKRVLGNTRYAWRGAMTMVLTHVSFPRASKALGIKRSTSFIANDAWIYDIVTVSATGAKPAAAATNYNVVCTWRDAIWIVAIRQIDDDSIQSDRDGPRYTNSLWNDETGY